MLFASIGLTARAVRNLAMSESLATFSLFYPLQALLGDCFNAESGVWQCPSLGAYWWLLSGQPPYSNAEMHLRPGLALRSVL